MAAEQLYLRKSSLLLVEGEKALDMSDMHIVFETKQDDEQSPNNCAIRVFNLSPATVTKVKGEYSRVVLQAGYENAGFGVIFDGTIKQFKQGRVDAKTTYLDLLAADGDIAYNFAVCSRSLAAGSKPQDRVNAVMQSFAAHGVTAGSLTVQGTGGILPRGKVLFGLARAMMRQQVENVGSTWNISNGQVNIIPLTGYLPGEAVVLTSATGLLGRPEQTQDGVKARCLINPRIQVGGLVRIDNASINQTLAHRNAVIPGAQLPYSRYAGLEMFADVTADGLYRVYVCEFKGDTRGLPWWQDLTLLAVDPVTLQLKAIS